MLRHGQAALGADVHELGAVADSFAELGARQLAAEALVCVDAPAGAPRHRDAIAALTRDELVVAPLPPKA